MSGVMDIGKTSNRILKRQMAADWPPRDKSIYDGCGGRSNAAAD